MPLHVTSPAPLDPPRVIYRRAAEVTLSQPMPPAPVLAKISEGAQ